MWIRRDQETIDRQARPRWRWLTPLLAAGISMAFLPDSLPLRAGWVFLFLFLLFVLIARFT